MSTNLKVDARQLADILANSLAALSDEGYLKIYRSHGDVIAKLKSIKGFERFPANLLAARGEQVKAIYSALREQGHTDDEISGYMSL